MMPAIHVFSEIGKLKRVIVHRPGREVENLTPAIMKRLLFDDIPYLPIAQKEHDALVGILQENGAEVLYLEQLTSQAIAAGQIKAAFLEKNLQEAGQASGTIHDALKEYLLSLDTDRMVSKLIEGVRKNELDVKANDLVSAVDDPDYPFYIDPLPSMYFTRDPQASIGKGITINRMTFAARQRESMFMETVTKYHPSFAKKDFSVWRNRDHQTHIEGGDELILSDHVLAIGISQRTCAAAIQDVAKKLFLDSSQSHFDTVIAIKIPENRAMMHLDTVLTMVNFDQFTVHPGILDAGGKIDTWTMHPADNGQGLTISYSQDLESVLKNALGVSELDLIPTGAGDLITAPREQWTDGSNTLAIAPGVVVTYDRNYVSNALLQQHGIKVIETVSSELSRGRGGPRCMTMPLIRDDI
ncbi:arginine deiminase [Oenococcus sp.]|uniref:arginine deiminase n=1 Tax=Oenococcus sp. TaxID=1979414 RepID=UPI0039E905C6